MVATATSTPPFPLPDVTLKINGLLVTVRAGTTALSLCVASGPVGYLAPRH